MNGDAFIGIGNPHCFYHKMTLGKCIIFLRGPHWLCVPAVSRVILFLKLVENEADFQLIPFRPNEAERPPVLVGAPSNIVSNQSGQCLSSQLKIAPHCDVATVFMTNGFKHC